MSQAVPLQIRLTSHAERDLLRIPDEPRQRVKADILALAHGQLPFGQLKKLQGFSPPVWQLTSGRFRVLYRRMGGEELLLLRVVAKSEQRDVFRSMR